MYCLVVYKYLHHSIFMAESIGEAIFFKTFLHYHKPAIMVSDRIYYFELYNKYKTILYSLPSDSVVVI